MYWQGASSGVVLLLECPLSEVLLYTVLMYVYIVIGYSYSVGRAGHTNSIY